jgi:hypothetical protein
MSRAFVREEDAGDFEPLPDRPVSTAPNDVTSEGLIQIESHIQAEQQALAAAQAAADRAAIAVATRELRYWTSRRATARVVGGPTERREIRFGSTVTIARDGARVQTFCMVARTKPIPKVGPSRTARRSHGLFSAKYKIEGDAAKLGEQEITIRQ